MQTRKNSTSFRKIKQRPCTHAYQLSGAHKPHQVVQDIDPVRTCSGCYTARHIYHFGNVIENNLKNRSVIADALLVVFLFSCHAITTSLGSFVTQPHRLELRSMYAWLDSGEGVWAPRSWTRAPPVPHEQTTVRAGGRTGGARVHERGDPHWTLWTPSAESSQADMDPGWHLMIDRANSSRQHCVFMIENPSWLKLTEYWTRWDR